MVEEERLYQQLHKLSGIESAEEEAEGIVEHMLLCLWKSRKTGLPSSDKSHFQSLLHLPSLSQLDPVLACLRSLMRKFVHENLNGDDLLKLFPPDLPLHLQTILIFLFQKHRPQWKIDISTDQHPSLRPSSLISQPLWPCQNDPHASCFGDNYLGGSAPIIADSNSSLLAPMSLQRDAAPLDDQGKLPRLKSMTWSMEKGKSISANKVAVISLKLQDYTNSTSGEMEVKFRLTRETLEAMLRSMTYISEQLSSIVGSSSGPVQKKQRQSDHIV